MANKSIWAALALSAMMLSGCTGGSDGDGDSDGTTSGGVGVGGTVSGPGGGVGGNATVSGSGTSSNSTSTGPQANSTADVTIESGNKFTPSAVTIAVGGTVTWTHNDGSNAHTVTADDDSFDSSPTCAGPLPIQGDCLTSGEKFSATFAEVGEFSYHCKIHSGMTGTVTVVEA